MTCLYYSTLDTQCYYLLWYYRLFKDNFNKLYFYIKTSLFYLLIMQDPGSSLPPSGSKATFTRSMGLTGTSVGRHSFDEGRNALAKSWAGPDIRTEGSKYRPSSASKAGRDYPRPWLSGSSKSGKGGGAVDKDNMRPLRTGILTGLMLMFRCPKS